MPDSAKPIWLRLGPALVCLALLAAIAGLTATRPRAADAAPYHQAVADAAADTPMQIGDWLGHDEPVPASAQDLLQPNAIISRRFTNQATGETATFLLVHCKDTRDMAGHYPPNCYPGSGYEPETQRPYDLTIDSVRLNGRAYTFTYGPIGREKRIHVANVLLLPDGRTEPRMTQLRRAAADYRLRPFGAGQVQVVTDDTLTPQRRDEVVRQLIAANLEPIRAILNAPAADQASSTSTPSS